MLYPRRVGLNVWLIAAHKEGQDLEEALRMNALGHNLTVLASEAEFDACAAGLEADSESFPHLVMYLISENTANAEEWVLTMKASGKFRHVPLIVFFVDPPKFDLTGLYAQGVASVIRVPVRFQGLVEVMRVIEAYWFKVALTP
ncbi:MAG: hypothetical protein GYB26_02120 [Gammaproteobacteria bacterium]|uniref:Response regulatory domain-containing protein n=1 Tax=Marinobacter litoralis TaxID=187981 RepID=A0A3M2RCB0_9GAMM|nr:hypothetical protein [Marinobacter litoralis]MBR9869917.1 hypothetical protein [Gammaproteobacteria bacterium]RMJ02645.1 hypothetical protein DOQ08_02108 [Marinobacter litoralis]